MQDSIRSTRSLARTFFVYAAVSLIPVLILGVALSRTYQREAHVRGLAEGRSEAMLVAQTAIEPRLDGQPLSEGLSPEERADMTTLVARAVRLHHILRLRLRDLAGRVVFSDDGSGLRDEDDDEALDAAAGSTVVELTHVNDDSNDAGARGAAAVEVYLPLTAGTASHRVGVLEVYLPDAPIHQDVTASMDRLYLDLAIGLALLYLALLAICVSVTRRLRQEVTLNAFLAEHDPLTELPNRALFRRRATAAVESARRHGAQVALAIVDLDRFKEVNDTLGHHSGDRLLGELAQRLSAHMRPEDTVARLGGDEFGIVLSSVDHAEASLWELRQLIDEEVEVGGLPLSVEASIGYVLAPDDGSDIDDLMQHADVAMYMAKTQHCGVARYDAAQDHYDANNLALIGELRHAIAAGQLVLHYQPKVYVSDRTVEAVEALVRWQHPVHGLIYPDRFIPLAEQTDLIDALTNWVLSTALSELRDMGSRADDLAVAVNVSARSLNHVDFAHQVEHALDHAGLSPSRLIIEITETALLTDPDRAAEVLAQLHRLGVRASLDDFGRGQTSLGFLSRLPVHELKIDKSFVADMLTNSAHAAIVRSIVELGHNLAFRVVAEGVETAEVLSRLEMAGCDVVQGYLLARPMPLDRLREWMRAHSAQLLVNATAP